VSDPGDPAARLLVRIGNFVEPLTRFDRSHISMENSRHEMVGLMARQVFRVSFETQRSEGNGRLPGGVSEVADAAALTRESEAQLAASRANVPARLAAWAETHGEDPLARPAVEDCFSRVSPLGFVEPCAPCQGSGQVPCSVCSGAKELTCAACKGKGSSNCEVCEASGAVACQTCKGAGTVVEQKQRRVWDEATNKERIEHYQETITCPVCDRAGSVTCRRCSGSGQLTCPICQGRKTTTCAQCKGTGTEPCKTCGGEGRKYRVAALACTIKETFEVAPKTSDPEVAGVLKARTGIEEILKLSSSYHATAEANADTLRRDTLAMTPVTSVVIAVGEERVMIRGFGAEQTVLDYKNIAGILLAPDLLELGIAISSTQLFPPRASEQLHDALSNVLASEANITIATTVKNDHAAMEQKFRGVIASDHIKRAAVQAKKGLARAYWAGLARGPAAALALPLFFAPIDLFLRGSGVGARVAILLAIMALTFGLCAAGHYWVVRQLQKRLSPRGKPKIGPLLDRTGLTATWLIGAGAVAIALTLLIAGLTSSLFPPR
jgi:hypothetical protein